MRGRSIFASLTLVLSLVPPLERSRGTGLTEGLSLSGWMLIRSDGALGCMLRTLPPIIRRNTIPLATWRTFRTWTIRTICTGTLRTIRTRTLWMLPAFARRRRISLTTRWTILTFAAGFSLGGDCCEIVPVLTEVRLSAAYVARSMVIE